MFADELICLLVLLQREVTGHQRLQTVMAFCHHLHGLAEVFFCIHENTVDAQLLFLNGKNIDAGRLGINTDNDDFGAFPRNSNRLIERRANANTFQNCIRAIFSEAFGDSLL